MKMFAILLAALGLSGCIAVPVSEAPGAYVGVPFPSVVVRPYYGYGGYGGYRGYRHYGGDRYRSY